DELATTYESNNLDALYKLILQHKETLVKDHNFGLAKQLFPALQRRIVRSLTKTFLTLSLVDIGERIKTDTVAETEAFILSCIKNGDIEATISQKDGMVSFQGASTSSANHTREELTQRLDAFMKLTQTLENAEYAMSTDTKYVEKMI